MVNHKTAKFSVDGVEKSITIHKIRNRDRTRIFEEYLNLDDFIKNKDKKDVNLMDYIKPNKSLLRFMDEINEACIAGVTHADLTAEEADQLFNKYGNYMLGNDTKN